MIQPRNRRILYVDDTEEQRYAMRRILESAGFTVIEAGTGTEALRALEAPGSDRIELVILDVKLPDMSGYDVCRRIKSAPATASMPVLQVSASFADPVLRASGFSGGADAYVAQPVHPSELLSLVNALMRTYDSEKTLRFQAQVSSRLVASLNYEETLRSIETVFQPLFADRCYVLLHGGAANEDLTAPADVDSSLPLPPELEPLAREVAETGVSRMIDSATLIVPLQVGRKRLGALVFQLLDARRVYLASNLSLAENLADRAALALQNASLYTAQQAAQKALVQSEKLAAAGRLSAAIAHEINNPLESITNLMYLIDTSPEITPTLKGYVQEALSELSRLTHIARQSLGFYRELTGPITFDLNESVESTLQIYLKRFQARHVEIERDYHPGKLEMIGVKGEIRQVISNLLVNAYDAMGGEGILRLETALLPPDANVPGAQPMVLLRATDNGSGIRPENLNRIFEPFFTTKEGTGTGLGLWVSENIVRKHGGAIRVVSHTEGPERGTSFEVTLPVGPAV
ncbi:His Kinase A (phospho-acceptor) domain-containing protein [Granulicella rosea]|uniref:histidine kinase n=1 Tax=Granulicella rosea TaxID=474952 RepID=A0A239KUT0_9BACT|nr:ATP-binding protein [Granulicella rosea]SNT20994.1 His Kinase A (phospho-acceptor) domain-containing protein [Granulicella rosea]